MSWNPKNNDSDDEETDDAIGHSWGLRDGLIYLIEVSESMIDENESESSILRTSLECCIASMQNKIISSPNDKIGIVLYGTARNPPPEGNYTFKNNVLPKHVAVYMPLQNPNAEFISFLQGVKNSDDLKDLATVYGHSKDFSLSDALWVCAHLFSTSDTTFQTSTILLFTDNDNPHSNDAVKTQQALRKASDLAQLHIDLDVVPLKSDFNWDLFYKEMVCTVMRLDREFFRMPDPSLLLERLLTRVIKRDHRHRCIVKLQWFLGEGVKMSVGLYNICRTTLQPPKIHLERQTNNLVTSAVRYLKISKDEFNDQIIEGPLPHSEQRKVQIFGGEEIIFKPEEVKALKRIQDCGLKLLGFKPLDCLSLEHHMNASNFVYPLEDMIEGSKKLFTTLLQRCLHKNKMAICVLTPKRNFSTRFVALIPQDEKVGDNDLQIQPPGFHLVHLPYAENMRSLGKLVENDNVKESTSEERQILSDIVSKLLFKYNPLDIENPKLQTVYSHIEALALDLEEPRVVKDDTFPDLGMQRTLLEDLPEQFVEIFGENQPVKPSSKRNRDDSSSSLGSSKLLKTSSSDDITEIEANIKSGKAAACTVPQLKAFLKSKNVAGLSKMKKGELLEAVLQYA